MPRARSEGRAVGLALCFAFVAFASCRDQGPVRAASIAVSQPALALFVGPGGGQLAQLQAAALDADGDTLPKIGITWSLSGDAHVSVTASGLVTALTPGTTAVRAAGGGKSATVAVTVSPVPVASLSVTLDSLALEVSILGAGTAQLVAQLRDSTAALLTDRSISWTSSTVSVATVGPTGLVTAVDVGTTVIRATSEGKTDSAFVTVNATSGFPAGTDILVTGVQWTQGSQDNSGTIPMLRNGRDAVVNVATMSDVTVPVPLEFALRLFDAGGNLTWADTISAPVVSGPIDPWYAVVQFLVPSAQLQPGVHFEVVRDPSGALPDANAANDRFPAAAPAPVNLITPPILRMRLVPIILLANGGSTPTITEGNVDAYLTMLRRMIPHGELEITIGTPFATSANFGTAPTGAAPLFWLTLLPQLDAARIADAANADAHWIGVVSPPAGFNFVTNGGWGYIPSDGASIGPATRTFGVIRTAWFTNPLQTPNLMAHELGHNLGRAHAPCGFPSAPDPSFPHPNGFVGGGGHDTYAWQIGEAPRAYPVGATLGDVMSYCSPAWISNYSYSAMLAFRGEVGAALMAALVPERVILVQGELAGSALSVTTARFLTAVASPDDPSSAWRIELIDADNRVLQSQRFALGRWDHTDAVRPFGVTLAVDAGTEANLRRVRVVGPSGVIAARDIDR